MKSTHNIFISLESNGSCDYEYVHERWLDITGFVIIQNIANNSHGIGKLLRL
jgi:hypothetical protein